MKLTCFRKHEDLNISFTEGLNCLRGANEAGKSTIAEAWAYCFFGTRALRDSLDDVVTWGHNPRELKVVVEYGDFVISRSKNGAEVTAMGQVHVTGQTDVTRFCEGLIGCDANTASNLMFAGQTGLRGVLESGPKATATLIEDLGEFDLFDRVLDAAQNKLALGSAAIQEDRLRTLYAQLGALPESEAPDEAAFDTQLSVLSDDLKSTELTLATLTPSAAALNIEYQAELAVRLERQRLEEDVVRIDRQIEESVEATAKVVVSGDIEDTTTLERLIAEAGEHEKVVAAYQKFLAVPVTPTHWSREMHAVQTQGAQAEIKAAREQKVKAEQDMRVAQAQLVTSSVCGFCGQDVSQFPEAAAKNAALQGEIAAAKESAAAAAKALATWEADLESLTARESAEARVLAAIRGIERWVDRDDSVIPSRITWKGQPPGEGPNVQALKAKLADTKAQNDAIIAARAKLEVLSEQRSKLSERRKIVAGKVAGIKVMTDAEFGTMAQRLDLMRQEIEKGEATQRRLMAEIQAVEQTRQQARAAWEQAQQRKLELEARIAETKNEIETLQFNNGLVRKVRAARPVVGNKLWTMVLASVSSIFSQMRGEQSIVEKGEDGFLINGKAVTSYSGSTLDLLGLAVRSALVKTFIPNCGFLVLDEPSSACDQSRTNAMLGYIAASGFKQVILVTHNDASESFADNLIQL
jgi:DNA repair exonuclease SbcCD ATPase subunit